MIPLTEEKRIFLYSMKEAQEKGVAYQNLSGNEFSGRYINIENTDLLNFANCSYLGLETDQRIKQAIHEATDNYGALLSNSRSYFSSPLYSELEGLLNRIFPGYQVVTTTTTLGHCSVLPVMIEKDDVIILDQFVHNSVRMASMLCKANGTTVKLARHNDMDYLDSLIRRIKTSHSGNIWYLADGLYSMQGNFIDIAALTSLLNEYENLFTYIDDAHGFSWTGKRGAGFVLGRHGIHPKMIVAVSMCKSFAAFGGIIIFPNREWAERIRYLGQTLIFSAPISPPILGAAIASAKIHLSDEVAKLQQNLMEKILYFRKLGKQKGVFIKTVDETPIQFIEIGENSMIYDLNRRLLNKGIFVTTAGYPAMPKKHGGLRISITRHLEYEDIDKLIDQIQVVDIEKYKSVSRYTHKSEDKIEVD